MALAATACGRPTGDFGRAEPSLLHDSWLPFVGDQFAGARGELVSDFNRTDNEQTLRDRAWALVEPPHLHDWFGEMLVEGQRTRVLPEIDQKFNIKAYYELLRRDPFKSSETRWQRLLFDMRTDAQLIGPFWREVRRVKADDAARLHSVDGRKDLTPAELYNATARIEENARLVDWVWRAMRFRLKSYRLCIDRMLIETPTERTMEINVAWDSLQSTIAMAEQDTHDLRFPASAAASPRPSRFAAQPTANEPVLKP
ncbi:MAG: hypothetical protein P4L82_09890 [Ancalomicrobiaceae bacterium]|nr:hypothetical protein [Ancalomicrobiaceae bacterium]